MSRVIGLGCRKDKVRAELRCINQLGMCNANYVFTEDDGRKRSEGETILFVSHHVK